jgi:hypothetical protein
MKWFWHTRPTWGHVALGIWLIAVNLLPMLGIAFPSRELVLAICGVVAGVLILMQR